MNIVEKSCKEVFIIVIKFYKKRSIGHYPLTVVIPNLTTTQECAMKAKKKKTILFRQEIYGLRF